MGRSSKPTVSALSPAFKQINKFFGKVDSDEDETHELETNTFSYGLIIGQMPQGALDPSNKKEDFSHPVGYIVYFARTPIEFKETEDDEDDDDVEVEVKSLDEVDPDWIMEHAKQVSPMLPGGIRVLGIYFVDEQSNEKVLNSKAVENCLLKVDSVLNPNKKFLNYLSMHFDRKNGKFCCEIVNICDKMANKVRKQADVEETGPGFRWQMITSKFLFDYPIVFKAGPESEQPILEKVKLALSLVESNLATSNILFNNMFRSKQEEFLDEKLLMEHKRTPMAKSKREIDEDDEEYFDDSLVKEYSAEILLDPEFQKSSDDVEILDVSSRMRLSGRMAIRAFLHPRATVAEAVEAIKTDLLKSLNARCEMHCDSLVGEEVRGAGDEVPVLHEPPRRVLIKLPDSEVTISDFLFPGEATEASAKAVEEMFGFVPELEDLDDEQELVASPKQVTSADDDEKITSAMAAMKTTASAKSSPFSPLSIVLSLLVAGLGIVFSYFYSMGTESDDDIDLEDLPPMPGEKRIPRREDI